MAKDRSSTRMALSLPVAGIAVLLLVVCLIECATEQRINTRGSKFPKLVQRINGWRSQRGASCNAYGHSCWGAHGKRSGSTVSTPDWYMSRIFRRMASNGDLNPRHAAKSDDISTLYRVDVDDTADTNRNMADNEVPEAFSRNSDGIPMLDDDLLSKMKLWQIMREASEEK